MIRRRIISAVQSTSNPERWDLVLDCGCTTYALSAKKPTMKYYQCGKWQHMTKDFKPKENL